jgi:hypothetical protein
MPSGRRDVASRMQLERQVLATVGLTVLAALVLALCSGW